MASLPLAYQISKCNLTSVNGRYQFSQTNLYVQSGGKYYLWKQNGIWTVSQGKENQCFASKPSALPTGVSWDYFSKTNKAIRPSSMVVEKAPPLSPTKPALPAVPQDANPPPAPVVKLALPPPPPAPVPVPVPVPPEAPASKVNDGGRQGRGRSKLVKEKEVKEVIPVANARPTRAAPANVPSPATAHEPASGSRSRRSGAANGATTGRKPRNGAPSATPAKPLPGAVDAHQAIVATSTFIVTSTNGAKMEVHVPTGAAVGPARAATAGPNVTDLLTAQALWKTAVEALDSEVAVLRGRLLENEQHMREQVAALELLTKEKDGLASKHASAARVAAGAIAELEKEKEELTTQIVSLTAQANAYAANLRVADGQNTALRKEAVALTESNVKLQDNVRVLREQKRALEDSAGFLSATNTNLTSELSSARDKLAVTTGKLADSEKRADNLIARAGQSHIKRDWQRIRGASDFPAGEDLKMGFEKPFLNFESFACDAITSLENLNHDEQAATGVFVHQVMTPMYAVTKAYVDVMVQERKHALKNLFGAEVPVDLTNDTVPKLFWFSTLQALLPPQILALTDDAIMKMVGEMGPTVAQVHERMLLDAEAGEISNEENDLRIPVIVRALLLLFTHVALSDPYCYLEPAPGTRLSYVPERFKEILSPGAKKHGQIKAGDTVEVVLCGLYFEDPTGALSTVKPIVPALVRRLVGAAATAPAPVFIAPASDPPPVAAEGAVESTGIEAVQRLDSDGAFEISG